MAYPARQEQLEQKAVVTGEFKSRPCVDGEEGGKGYMQSLENSIRQKQNENGLSLPRTHSTFFSVTGIFFCFRILAKSHQIYFELTPKGRVAFESW